MIIYNAQRISVGGTVRSTIRNASGCPFTWVRLLNLCMASDLYVFLRSPCRLSFQVFMANSFFWRSREIRPGTTWPGRDIDLRKYRRDIIGIIKFIKSVGQPNNTQPKPRQNPEAYASIPYVKGVSERFN